MSDAQTADAMEALLACTSLPFHEWPPESQAAEAFAQVKVRHADNLRRYISAFLGRGTAALHLSTIGTVAPVQESAGLFEFWPMNAPAPKKAWRVILSVRDIAGDPGRANPALAGEIYDLVACDLEMMKVTSRFLATAPVLGAAQHPEMIPGNLRVWETPLAWLRNGSRGVVPIGGDAELQSWAAGLSGGLIVSTVEMGEAMRKKLIRPAPRMPKLLVAA